VFWFALGPGPFFCCVFAVASRGETQIWLGDLRVVCRFAFFVFVLVFLLELPTQFINGTTAFHAEFLIRLTCLYQFQDRALERHRPSQRKKRGILGRPIFARLRFLTF
jgi:hypothetical protein